MCNRPAVFVFMKTKKSGFHGSVGQCREKKGTSVTFFGNAERRRATDMSMKLLTVVAVVAVAYAAQEGVNGLHTNTHHQACRRMITASYRVMRTSDALAAALAVRCQGMAAARSARSTPGSTGFMRP